MVKTVQDVAEGSRNWETCGGYAQSHANLFLSIAFQKRYFYFGTRFGYVKKHKPFITVVTTIHGVKLVWPAELILLTLTLLKRALPASDK